MEEENNNPPLEGDENLNDNQHLDDSIKPVQGENDEEPEIYQIYKNGKLLDRKDFLKSAAGVTGFAALGGLLQGCEESELDIISDGENCICHAVCTCDSESNDGDDSETENSYTSTYDQQQYCTCDTVCTCNSVCTCNTVCGCDSQGGGGGTYWYPN